MKKKNTFWWAFIFLGLGLNPIGIGSLSHPAYAGDGSLATTGGLNFKVNFRFPPTDAAIQELKSALTDADLILCDATEGQVRFDTIRISAGTVNEDQAAIWILPETGRSVSPFSGLGVLGKHVSLFSDDVDDRTIAHELGHFVFGIGDQYDEQMRFGDACGIGRGFEIGSTDDQNQSLMQSKSQTEFSVPLNHDPVQGTFDTMVCPPMVADQCVGNETSGPSRV